MTDAFAEGLNEGLRLTGYYVVMFFVGNRRWPPVETKGSEIAELVNNFVLSLRGEDFTAGVTISILPAKNADESATVIRGTVIRDNDVEDADVIPELGGDEDGREED